MSTNVVRSSTRERTRTAGTLARLRKQTNNLIKETSSALITRDELITAFLQIAADSLTPSRDKIAALKEIGKLQGYYDLSKYNTIDISSMPLEWAEPSKKVE